VNTPNLSHAPGRGQEREEALARRLEATDEALRERQRQLSAGQATTADLRAADAEVEQRLRARAARQVNRAWQAERHQASVMRRLRQRLRDAHLPLSWIVRRPLRFGRGAVRLGRQEFRRQVAELAESRLFDPGYYRAVTGVAGDVNLVARFLLHGDAAGESPHPLFDPSWYRLKNADLADADRPFQHYLRRGGWELRSPHPLFDPRYYLSQFPDGAVHAPTPLSHFFAIASLALVSPHPLFDPRHYLTQDPDPAEADSNMLLHYLATGAAEHLDPHPLFSSRFYLETNPDLRGRNPLDHFVRQGAAEGRSPHPLFDVRFYWEQRPVVRTSGGNALLDYLDRALDDDLDPHPLFDSSYYLEQAPTVRALGLNPLVHFLQSGWQRGLWPNRWFDPRWYLEQNPDVFDINPLQHFAEIGWKEGRDPSPDFSLSGYLAAHPDVAAMGENPLEYQLRTTRAGSERGMLPARSARKPMPRVFGTDSHDVTGRELAPTLVATVSQLTEFRLWMDGRAAPAAAIEASLRSLRDQLYPRWRIDVWTAAESARGLAATLVEDSRIRLHPLSLPQPPATRDELAAGDEGVFVGSVAAGDEFEPHALLFAAHVAQGVRPVDLVFADEDTVGAGSDGAPIFKPDFDRLLLESVDYLGSCAFVRLSQVRDSAKHLAGGPPATGRHDLLRRALRGLDSERSAHIPYILVHTHPANAYAARATTAPPADLAALAVTYGPLQWQPEAEPLVSIVIATRDGVDLLSTCVESILNVTAYRRFEIVVIDNGSTDPATLAYLARLAQRPRCRVVRSPGPFNYSRLNNLGASEARGEVLCLLNNDIEVTAPEWLGALVTFAGRAGVGAVGATLVYPDGSIQHGGVILGAREVAAHAFVGKRMDEPTYMNLARYPREVSAVTGACLVVARHRYFEVGGLDEQDLHVNFSDVDLCLKLRARHYRNVILPIRGLIHHESATRGDASRSRQSREQLDREALVMKQRWGSVLRSDPYYSEHLSLFGELHITEPMVRAPGLSQNRTRTLAPFTSLGREPRLDVYAGISNAARAAQATRPRTPYSAGEDTPAGLSVLILNRDAPELIVPLVAQLAAESATFLGQGLGFEALIGDTGSTDPAVLALYAEPPSVVRVIRSMRYNFSRCNNALEEAASFDTVLFLNNDVILPERPGVLLRAFRTLTSTPTLGVLGSVLFYPDGSIQHMGCALLETPQHWGLPYHVNTRSRIAPGSLPNLAVYPGVTGAFLMIRRRTFRQLGAFDPLYAAECQDIALCLEASRLGFETACAHLGPIVHIENATRPKGEENWSDRQRFLRKYGAFIRSLAG
jgi:GT2 family glycosyltransferase